MRRVRGRWNYQGGFVIRKSSRCRAGWRDGYFLVLALDVDLLCEGGGRAVDTGVVDAAQHQHLIVRLIAKAAGLAHFVHLLYLFISSATKA